MQTYEVTATLALLSMFLKFGVELQLRKGFFFPLSGRLGFVLVRVGPWRFLL
jgi:hypothetical protein